MIEKHYNNFTALCLHLLSLKFTFEKLILSESVFFPWVSIGH